jgi:hypothetical protein
VLRKSGVCAIDFPIAVEPGAFFGGGGLRIGVAFETEDNRGRIFFISIGCNPLKSHDSEK